MQSGETPQRPIPAWETTFQKWSADPRFEQPLKDLGAQDFDPKAREVLVDLVESKRNEDYSTGYRKGMQALLKATGKSPGTVNNLVDNIRAITESGWQKPHVVEFEK